NICRSPMAEAVMQKLVEEAGLSSEIQVDSAGTGSWHTGEKAHRGTRQILQKHGIAYNGRARQVTAADMQSNKSYIIAMDSSNLDDLHRRFGSHARLHRLLDFASQATTRDVPDPYYTGDFETVYQLVLDGCQGLLAHITTQENLT
ncbi:MAG: low molecular weight protein-tyrosine-phosphatase, partial [Anaerolineae bacterium]